MKRLLLIVALVGLIASCDLFILNNPYDPLSEAYEGIFNLTSDKVTAGSSFIAVLRDGTVYTVGITSYPVVCCLGHEDNDFTPVEDLPETVIDIVAASEHTLALTEEGEVWAWGMNVYGSTDSVQRMPAPVAGLPAGIVQITGDLWDSAALTADGTVYCWGTTGGTVPGVVYSGADQITGGSPLYILDGGAVYQWSSGTTTDLSLSGITAITAWSGNLLALGDDGTLYTRGSNNNGELGIGTTDVSSDSATITGLGTITAMYSGTSYNYILNDAGRCYAWGDNSTGLLGQDYWLPLATRPVLVEASGVTDVFLGYDFTGINTAEEGLIGFGDTWFGYQDTHGISSSFRDIGRFQVPGLPDPVIASAAGDDCFFALCDSGVVYAWGDNTFGKLGDGTETFRDAPVLLSGLSGITAVSANGYHAAAITSDSTLYCWGCNGQGQLGDGTYTDSSSPKLVAGLNDVRQVATGEDFTVVLKGDGTVWAWGDNVYGQLGNGTTDDSITPVQVNGLSDIYEIAVGDRHVLARNFTGTVWAWGDNTLGQLGDGTTANSTVPKVIDSDDLPLVWSITAAGYSSAGVSWSGNLYTWGSGNDDNDFTEIALAAGSVQDATAGTACVFVDDSGTLYGNGAFSSQIRFHDSDGSDSPYILEPFRDLVITEVDGNGLGFSVIDGDGNLYCWRN